MSFFFTLSGPLGTIFGLDLIFVLIFWPILLIAAFSLRSVFRNQPDRLAKRVGLALSPVLRWRLNRYLRLRLTVILLTALVLSQVFGLLPPSCSGRTGQILEVVIFRPWRGFPAYWFRLAPAGERKIPSIWRICAG